MMAVGNGMQMERVNGQPLVFMFSGQGSQYFQMGRDLFDSNAVFREIMLRGDRLIADATQCSVINTLYSQPVAAPLSELIITHPALVLVQYATYRVLVEEGIRPDYVWGSSLGEFAAGLAAEVWTLETALAAAIEQARCIIRGCRRGGMIAVLASPAVYAESKELRFRSVIAAHNYDRHFTLAVGNAEDLPHVERELRARELSFITLPVDYGFHSAAIDKARADFEWVLDAFPKFAVPKVPLYSSVVGGEVTEVSGRHFWDAVREPIQFKKTYLALERAGGCRFVDCGPSGTLATFVKYNRPEGARSRVFPVLSPFRSSSEHINTIKESAVGCCL